MRKIVIQLLLSWLCLGLAGCGKSNSAASGSTGNTTMAETKHSGPTDAEIPVTVVDNVQVVKMTGDDAMHYNGDRFTVHSEQQVRVDLKNVGSKPATEMEHDFVLLKAGTDALLFNLTCAAAKDSGYLPKDQLDKVIAHTAFAGPGQTVSISFAAPPAGKYIFLCNYPGHYEAGMHGIMTVEP